MADDNGVNKEYKDRLFNFIFGREENKAWTLSLYNAVNGSSYTNPERKAVDKAITDMPDDYILKKYLVTHIAAVNGMLVTEYNEEETMERFKIDGIKEGSRKMIYELVADGDITVKKGAKKLGITVEELKNNMELTGYKFLS